MYEKKKGNIDFGVILRVVKPIDRMEEYGYNFSTKDLYCLFTSSNVPKLSTCSIL